MKHTTLILPAFLVSLFITGCGVLQKAYTPVYTAVPEITRTNTITVTNTTVVPIYTNVVTHEVVTQTNIVVTPQTIVTITPATVVTNWEKNAAVTTGLNVAGQLGSASGVPFAGTIAGVLGLLYGIGASIMSARTKNKGLAVASTLVDNIEAARALLKSVPNGPELDAKYVAGIADSQTAAGVRADIHKLVQNQT